VRVPDIDIVYTESVFLIAVFAFVVVQPRNWAFKVRPSVVQSGCMVRTFEIDGDREPGGRGQNTQVLFCK
jgi:hypothetical protein